MAQDAMPWAREGMLLPLALEGLLQQPQAIFLDGDVFTMGVDDEHELGKGVHVLDAAESEVQLVELALEDKDFLLLVTVDGAVGEHGFELLQAFDALLDGDEVGEGAAHPAVGDGGLTGAGGFGSHGFLSLTLGADEEHLAAVGDGLNDLVVSGTEQLHSLLEVDDMDAVTSAEDEGAHLGVPTTGLMPEMTTRFQKIVDRNFGHFTSSFHFAVLFNVSLHVYGKPPFVKLLPAIRPFWDSRYAYFVNILS